MCLNIKELMFCLILDADIKIEGTISKKWEIMKKKEKIKKGPVNTRTQRASWAKPARKHTR